jgi:hypothetical protein
MKLTGESRSTRGKTCPCATLSTINPTWTDPGSNPGFRGERPATNRLSHGTAKSFTLCKKRANSCNQLRHLSIPLQFHSSSHHSLVSQVLHS